MSESIQCIGGMCGNDWYAELHFGDAQAHVFARDEKGSSYGPIAIVYMGAHVEETDDEDADLCADDKQNQNIQQIVAVPRLMRTLRFCQKYLTPRDDQDAPDTDQGLQNWREDHEMLREIDDVLEWATLNDRDPQPTSGDHER